MFISNMIHENSVKFGGLTLMLTIFYPRQPTWYLPFVSKIGGRRTNHRHQTLVTTGTIFVSSAVGIKKLCLMGYCSTHQPNPVMQPPLCSSPQ